MAPKSKVYHFNPETFFLQSWGEEQQLVFVVLPKRKNDEAMLDSTYLTHKTREEQQQMQAKLLFYQSTKTTINHFLQSLLTTFQFRLTKTQNQRNQQFRDKAARKSEMASLLKQRMTNSKFYYALLNWERPYRGDICSELNVERYELRQDGTIGYSHQTALRRRLLEHSTGSFCLCTDGA